MGNMRRARGAETEVEGGAIKGQRGLSNKVMIGETDWHHEGARLKRMRGPVHVHSLLVPRLQQHRHGRALQQPFKMPNPTARRVGYYSSLHSDRTRRPVACH